MHLQSEPPLDYPLSFPQQTPCYYPHPEPPVPFVQTVIVPEAEPAPNSSPLPVEDTEVRGDCVAVGLQVQEASGAWLGFPVAYECLDLSLRKPRAGYT